MKMHLSLSAVLKLKLNTQSTVGFSEHFLKRKYIVKLECN